MLVSVGVLVSTFMPLDVHVYSIVCNGVSETFLNTERAIDGILFHHLGADTEIKPNVLSLRYRRLLNNGHGEACKK